MHDHYSAIRERVLRDLRFGSDPEFPLFREGRAMPASELGLEGPLQKRLYPQGAIFRDGWNIELNPHPANEPTAHYGLFKGLLAQAQTMVGQLQDVRGGRSHYLSGRSAFRIRNREKLLAPLDALEFGCQPSMNAYHPGEALLPTMNEPADMHPFRYAGGHVHLSLRKEHDGYASLQDPANYPLLVKWLDAYVGLPITWLFKEDPGQFLRRRYYGKAGEYRIQNYPDGSVGLEYRVLGPEIFNHPAYFSLVCRTIQKVMEFNWLAVEKHWREEWDTTIPRAINTGEGLDKILFVDTHPYHSFYHLWDAQTLRALKMVRGKQLFSLDALSTSNLPWEGWVREWGLPFPGPNGKETL